MKHPKIPLAQTVIQLCKAKNIQHIVLSPGSRNAPLTIGFTHDPFFKCYSIVDERCAAFFAMGIAQQIQEPVAVVCTSGSALLNYYPAVAEAYYSNIPLVVLSADRPKYLVGIGDGQTINQEDVYKNHILYSANLKQDLDKENKLNKNELPILKSIENKLEKDLDLQKIIQQHNEEQVNKAINISVSQKGPVHINVPFNEPLYDMVDELVVNPEVIPLAEKDIENEDLSVFLNLWNTAKRKLVLVGVNQPNTVEQEYLNLLAQDESVLVLTETTSNMHNERFIPGIDKLIAALNTEELEQLKPEILLTFGGLVVSKKIKKFLRDCKLKQHWHIGEHHANDTFFALNKAFKMPVNTFFSQFLEQTKAVQSEYNSFWLTAFKSRREKHEIYLKTIPFSDFKVFELLLKSIPNDSKLQVGNSSTIRYTQLFDLKKSIEVFCNRGTSGIDGSTSTAIGAALASKLQTTFITGDLSFLYDSNAFWNNYIPNNFRVIVVNNGGGGIFRILPGHKNTPNYDTYFETKHNLTAKQLCAMYGFKYNTASSETELVSVLNHFYVKDTKPKLLEIFTPNDLNDETLLKYFSAIK
ncbi:2-succinyl-5-enolpyruvyl-6-hydroxy-3-cyclohexene-1-carboxylic-acid synthase [Lacinutrix sp. Bg11-31]|uniref:2-succinyl-5-enolpyruvyl-6-hydroxy-3- cyclohexene-1-carboxylic-acid synthase n=1 Tax=Lacinutrix sp. Bg11-31 TaxID=2057808 RepID=UPI000C30687F|nr:2-succinyl-5-enolpyruvyl-6-hydroxy-3-cyclohexene-1-carboxylic-acid synthase [Lacinutrix sp. Bg11-31]AUC81258.1 2-succinyl-5-enolpyruvyl-6-hydroxy-3-cyclohexene-1-carboxylic-acid synthase [Lacinutrix sp. Bg11-31]